MINKTSQKILRGQYLIAKSYMIDPIFKNSVLLILEHNKQGALGVIINKVTTDITINDLFPKITSFNEIPVHIGGPIEISSHFSIVYCSDKPIPSQMSSKHFDLYKNVYCDFFRDKQLVFEYFNNILDTQKQPKQMQIIIGYSGWSAGQLEQELVEQTWIPLPFAKDLLFIDKPKAKKIWLAALRKKGGIYEVFANSGQNPFLN